MAQATAVTKMKSSSQQSLDSEAKTQPFHALAVIANEHAQIVSLRALRTKGSVEMQAMAQGVKERFQLLVSSFMRTA